MNILTYIYDITRNYHTAIIALFLVVLFAYIGYVAYQHYFAKKQKKKPFDNVANAGNKNPVAKIYYFYADWCPYCKKTIDDWNIFKQTVGGTVVNGYLVECISIRCSDDNGDGSPIDKDTTGVQPTPAEVTQLINQYQINSYPTVKLIKDDETIEYDAKITYENLETFANTVL